MLLSGQSCEDLDSFSKESKVLVSGIQMLARDFWQGASPRMQARYAEYAMTWQEFCESKRKYEADTEQGAAVALEDVCTFVDECIGLRGFGDDEELDVRAQGANLKQASKLLAYLGMPACQGDFEVFLATLRDAGCVTAERYTELIRPENRTACALLINPMYEVTAYRYATLAHKRRVTVLDPILFKGGSAAIDVAVIETGYLIHGSILNFLEPVRGTA